MSDDEEDGGGDGGGFRLMFVTLSLILLAFFILLNSMATMDNSKKKKALGSLLGSFGMLPGSGSVEADNNKVLNKEMNITPSSSSFKIFMKIKNKISELSKKSSLPEGKLDVSYDESTGEIKVIISEELLFAPGKSVISPRVFPILKDIGKLAVDAEAFVNVVGHTDDAGRAMDNWKLSIERGMVVARNIEDAGRIPLGMICAGGASFYHPRKDNETREGQMGNRRVEVLVQTRKEGL